MTQMEKPRQVGRKWICQGQPAVGRPGAALALLSPLGRHGCWARVVLTACVSWRLAGTSAALSRGVLHPWW